MTSEIIKNVVELSQRLMQFDLHTQTQDSIDLLKSLRQDLNNYLKSLQQDAEFLLKEKQEPYKQLSALAYSINFLLNGAQQIQYSPQVLPILKDIQTDIDSFFEIGKQKNKQFHAQNVPKTNNFVKIEAETDEEVGDPKQAAAQPRDQLTNAKQTEAPPAAQVHSENITDIPKRGIQQQPELQQPQVYQEQQQQQAQTQLQLQLQQQQQLQQMQQQQQLQSELQQQLMHQKMVFLQQQAQKMNQHQQQNSRMEEERQPSFAELRSAPSQLLNPQTNTQKVATTELKKPQVLPPPNKVLSPREGRNFSFQNFPHPDKVMPSYNFQATGAALKQFSQTMTQSAKTTVSGKPAAGASTATRERRKMQKCVLLCLTNGTVLCSDGETEWLLGKKATELRENNFFSLLSDESLILMWQHFGRAAIFQLGDTKKHSQKLKFVLNRAKFVDAPAHTLSAKIDLVRGRFIDHKIQELPHNAQIIQNYLHNFARQDLDAAELIAVELRVSRKQNFPDYAGAKNNTSQNAPAVQTPLRNQ